MARDVRKVYSNSPKANKPPINWDFCNNEISTCKYGVWNFFPLNLLEQLRRIANVYFLMVCIVELIPGVSPITPITSILPLALVLLLTAAKDAYEDICRAYADKKANMQPVNIISRGELYHRTFRDVHVGDVVYVKENQQFPADCVLLSSSDDHGLVYVETSNLDGESEAKIKVAPAATRECQDHESIAQLRLTVECGAPIANLYKFDGDMKFIDKSDDDVTLSTDQFLLRGSFLKNTKFIYALVVYTGNDTRLIRNQQEQHSKFSRVEHRLNAIILAIFLLQATLSLICSIAGVQWKMTQGNHMWYLGMDKTFKADYLYGVFNFLTFMVLYNQMVPISLLVSAEMAKLAGGIFISNDLQMYHSELNEPAVARTTNLIEDLGQVQYVFSDKTGTLTENVMRFRKCSIAGQMYDASDQALLAAGEGEPHPSEQILSDHVNEPAVKEFMTAIALCHSVRPINNDGSIEYQASSPDEEALVEAAMIHGYTFKERGPDYAIIGMQGADVRYEILNVLDFDPERKRMSVIVRMPSGDIKLFCKGADSAIFPRLFPDQPVAGATYSHLEAYASQGLRTMCVASANLTENEYSKWKELYRQAEAADVERSAKVTRTADMIERKLTILGVTGIEDKLQDGVPEALSDILQAGVKVWVLTGDKQETAINVGFLCHLLRPSMTLIRVNAISPQHCEALLWECINRYLPAPQGNCALIIDGETLNYSLTNHRDLFLKLSLACQAVICCRMSPLQKATVVRLVKNTPSSPVCLAIGDGANDVSMIKEANIGVGISGREGRQAVLASDFSFAQFQYLRRLLLKHGRHSYLRLCALIQYTLYKNLTFSLPEFYFAVYNGFSGRTLYDAWCITIFNVVFTSWPVLIHAIFEKDIDDHFIFEYPELYRRLQQDGALNARTLAQWFASAVWHSVVIFYGPYYLFQNDPLLNSGESTGIWCLGLTALSICVVVVNLKIALETRYWTSLTHLSIWGSILVYFIFLFPYCSFVKTSPNMYNIIFTLMSSWTFWFALLVLPVLALLPDFALKYIHRTYFPADWQVIQELNKPQEQKPLIVGEDDDYDDDRGGTFSRGWLALMSPTEWGSSSRK